MNTNKQLQDLGFSIEVKKSEAVIVLLPHSHWERITIRSVIELSFNGRSFTTTEYTEGIGRYPDLQAMQFTPELTEEDTKVHIHDIPSLREALSKLRRKEIEIEKTRTTYHALDQVWGDNPSFIRYTQELQEEIAKRELQLAEWKTANELANESILLEVNGPLKIELDDPLHSVLMDARGSNQSFEDWCDDLGYDTDSRRAYAIWQECRSLYEEINASVPGGMDGEAITKAEEILQDY